MKCKKPCILKRHMQVHRTYVCKVCSTKFEDVQAFNEHKRNHAKDKDYACTECGMKFRKPYILRRHMLIHTGERPFTCEVCGQQYTRAHLLKEHMRIHSGERPYVCTVCAKTFVYSPALKRHMITHTGEKRYTCVVCSHKFGDCGNLSKHMRTHTGERPYSCAICQKTFSQSDHLRKHLRCHRGDRSWENILVLVPSVRRLSHNLTTWANLRCHHSDRSWECTLWLQCTFCEMHIVSLTDLSCCSWTRMMHHIPPVMLYTKVDSQGDEMVIVKVSWQQLWQSTCHGEIFEVLSSGQSPRESTLILEIHELPYNTVWVSWRKPLCQKQAQSFQPFQYNTSLWQTDKGLSEAYTLLAGRHAGKNCTAASSAVTV